MLHIRRLGEIDVITVVLLQCITIQLQLIKHIIVCQYLAL